MEVEVKFPSDIRLFSQALDAGRRGREHSDGRWTMDRMDRMDRVQVLRSSACLGHPKQNKQVLLSSALRFERW